MDLNLKDVSERAPGSVAPPKKIKFTERIKAKINKIRGLLANPKKRLIFIILIGLLIILLIGTGLYFASRNDETSKEQVKEDAIESPVLYQAPLDGVMTDADSSKRHPLAIVVENHSSARPHTGINKASVVYEAIAEGGITRYLAIYGTNESEQVGPIRSARTYFVDWAHGYNAYLAHVGGNIDALDQIKTDKTLDLDQFHYSSAYWRDNSAKVSSEHTMFASTTKLRASASENKYTTANNFAVYKFADDPKENSNEAKLLPLAQIVDVNYGNSSYNVSFNYDKATNSYNRSVGGKADLDRVSNEQVSVKNIIVMTVKRQATTTRINESGYNMTTNGEGVAKIYLNGKEIIGKWKKSSANDREIFYDQDGKEVIFNRGKFWICVIPPEATSTSQITPATDPVTTP